MSENNKETLASIFLHIQGKWCLGPKWGDSLPQFSLSCFMFKCSQDWKVIRPLPDHSGLLPGRHLLFILHVLCKTTYCSEKLFDMFRTLRANENGTLKEKKKKKKPEQRRQKHDLQDQALIRTLREKSFRCKELSDLTTSFLLRLHCHKRSLHFQWQWTDSPLSLRPAAAYWIFVPSQTLRLFCEQCWREKELQRKRTSEDKGTGQQVPVTSVSILLFGWWQNGRPTFHRFSNMAPKAHRSGSW